MMMIVMIMVDDDDDGEGPGSPDLRQHSMLTLWRILLIELARTGQAQAASVIKLYGLLCHSLSMLCCLSFPGRACPGRASSGSTVLKL